MLLLLIIQLYFVIICGAERCVVPTIKNGRARSKGLLARHMRFSCKKEYQLMGAKYAHCIRGSWDVEEPVCIKPGCKWNQYGYVNGEFIESYRGALLKVDCNPGYIAPDGNTVYCDGILWNHTFPTCQPMYQEPQKNCQFENDGWCGWVPDLSHKAIRWVLGKNSIPKTDHTSMTQPLTNGEYMYVKDFFTTSYTVFPEITLKLYSPVYPPSYTKEVTCFSFWYSMQGPTFGDLKIYLLLEGEQVDSTLPSFWVSGHQGYKWNRGFFFIQKPKRNFQILIEVIKRGGFEVAIDDVALGIDNECQEETTETTTEELTTDEFDSIDDFTCRFRCGMESVLVSSNITADDLGETPKCDCHLECWKSQTCCHDVFQFCLDIHEAKEVPHSTEDSTTILDEEITSVSSTHTFLNMPTTSNNNLSKTKMFPPTTIKNLFKLNPYLTTTFATEVTTNTKDTIRTTTQAPHLTISQNNTRFNMNKNALQSNLSITSKKTTVNLKPTYTTTTMTNDIPIMVGNNPIQPNLKISEEHNFIFNSKLSDQTKARKEAASPSEGLENGTGVMGVEISNIIELAVGSIVAILLILSIILFIMRRRRRLAEQFEGAEDSEVSLIASDEYLDFTLQKPADSEL